MILAKNLGKTEKAVRIILGIALIVIGFFLHGLWKPLSIVIGILLIAAAFAGY